VPLRPPLIGTYHAPAVKRGEVVTCLYRDRDCKVTSWTDAPIPWPRVQPRDQRGGSGLWVNDTLARAIKTESAVALRYWFGVSVGVVWKWRRAFGVGGRATTPGSRRAVRAAALQGAAAVRAKEWTDEELDAKAEAAKRCGNRPPPRWTPATGAWTAAQLKLLGTDHDEAIAERIGRTPGAVRCKRTRAKIPAYRDRRRM
jgi:transposase-like protein